MPAVDTAVVLLLAIATARGLWLGLVREAFSLAGIAAAGLAAWQFAEPAAKALAATTGDAIPAVAIHGIAVAGLALGTLLAVAMVGRLIRRGLQFAGLGLADRLAGGCLGALEGALVVGLVLGGASTVLGRDHAWLASSQALAAYERIRAEALPDEPQATPARDVAAPAPRRAP